jgi:hypothetical protein
MNVRFCPSCRSLILADFRYCPYCGEAVAVKGPGLSETLDGAFEELDGRGAAGAGKARADGASSGASSGASRSDVFASAQASLDRLEADMDLLLDEIEKEGRSPK